MRDACHRIFSCRHNLTQKCWSPSSRPDGCSSSSCCRSSVRNEDLAARFAGQRGILNDEAGKMLIPKKYMEGHTETMMEMFDAPRLRLDA
ncbi:MAG: hypothetical protein IPK17_38765 [Chloroflexi bacterium]|uniref:hypothetical protein n=1 Tax=Candidatus Flexifilum breve TaxID=3140694 RepID=UPI003136078B|nr:hypothetical protein [Chloroflexota bacterium]